MTVESATARLERLLTMVPWLLRHPGAPITQVATTFGITAAAVEADLSLIFLCGTPGGMPQDLIEAYWDNGEVFVGNADEISRPLRLAPDEALTLMVALQALAAVPGIAEAAVIASAMAKLTQASGHAGGEDAQQIANRFGVELADDDAARWFSLIRQGVSQRRRLRIEYLNVTRDELTTRDVDAMRLAHAGAHWYVEGWCHRAGDVRLFRLDRIQSAQVLDVEATLPAGLASRLDEGSLYSPTHGAIEVTLLVEPAARWIVDYYRPISVEPEPEPEPEPVEGEGEAKLRAEPRLRVRLLADDPAWVRRLMWRLGGSAVVIAPAFLAAEVARGANRALAAYQALPVSD